jgi:hypothetical protein
MTTDDTSEDTSAESGAWLSIPEAARQLRIAVRTVHRRVEAGQLSKRDLERGRVEVWVPRHLTTHDPSESTPGASQTTSDSSLALSDQQMEFIEAATRHMTALVEELAVTRRQMSEKDQELGRLREVERQLRTELEAERASHVTSGVSDTRPWWRFWTRKDPGTS